MRKQILLTIISSVVFCNISFAQYYNEQNSDAVQTDTIMVYNSWNSIFAGEPDTTIINPTFEFRSYYDFDIKSSIKGDKATKQMLREKTIAIAIGDSIWYMSSYYLKRNFQGDSKLFNHFVPFYFSEKVAFVEWTRTQPNFGETLLSILVTGLTDIDIFEEKNYDIAPYYYIDFQNKTITKIDQKFLKKLLSNYTQLARRYEQMHDYKETYMINQFFLEWTRLIEDDPDFPYIQEE